MDKMDLGLAIEEERGLLRGLFVDMDHPNIDCYKISHHLIPGFNFL